MAQCQPQEMIIIESAVFGRMQVGRCVAKNYGHLGCPVGTDRGQERRSSWLFRGRAVVLGRGVFGPQLLRVQCV